MKLKKYSDIEIESSEDISEDLDIAMTKSTASHIIRALSNTIYKDKPGSMVREMVSNAWDANKEAKSKEPVYLEIRDNQLIIRDAGPGFSKQRIKDVFINFGESTKRGSNDEHGGFGIGSKTPLAYTTDFTIRTWVDGIEYTYLIHKTNDLPKVKLLGEKDAPDHSNGTEAIIAIKPGDMSTIQAAIRGQLLYFDNLIVLGVSTWNNDIDMLEGDTFVFNQTMPPPHMNIKLGQVAYPLDKHLVNQALDKYLRKHQHTNFVSKDVDVIYNIPLGIKFEIGELPVVLSREAIEYSDGVEGTIVNRLVETIEELFDLYKKQADAQAIDDPNITVFDYMDQKSKRILTLGSKRYTLESFTFLPKSEIKGFEDFNLTHFTEQLVLLMTATRLAAEGKTVDVSSGSHSVSIANRYKSVYPNGGALFNSFKSIFLSKTSNYSSKSKTNVIILAEPGQTVTSRKLRYIQTTMYPDQTVVLYNLRSWATIEQLSRNQKHLTFYKEGLEAFLTKVRENFEVVDPDSIQVPKGWGIKKVNKALRLRCVRKGNWSGSIYSYREFKRSSASQAPWVLLTQADSEKYDEIAASLDINIAYCAKTNYEELIQTGEFMKFDDYLLKRKEFRHTMTLYAIGRKYRNKSDAFLSRDDVWRALPFYLNAELADSCRELAEKLVSKHFTSNAQSIETVFLDYIDGNPDFKNFYHQEWLSVADQFVEFIETDYITDLSCVPNKSLVARIYLKLFKEDKITHEYIKNNLLRQIGTD